MSVNHIPLSALVEARAVLREIHEIIGPNPRAVIPPRLYTRLISAEFHLATVVDRVGGEVPVEVAEPETVYEKSARWSWPDGRPDL